MAESDKADMDSQPDVKALANEIPPMGWCRSSIGVGSFVMICALFAMASGNHLANFLGKLFLVVALLLIAVPIAIKIVNSVLSTIKRLTGTTTKGGA